MKEFKFPENRFNELFGGLKARIIVVKNTGNQLRTINNKEQRNFVNTIEFYADKIFIDQKVFGTDQIPKFLDFIKCNYDEKSYFDVEEIVFQRYL
ncbi:MAG: hypothetical protein K9H48_07685 [Melioribacteraceae bacterium]|nr:hypothetical protein [Melioribacteraceae bacterium]